MRKLLLAVPLVLALAGCTKAVTSSAKHVPSTTAVVTTSQPPVSFPPSTAVTATSNPCDADTGVPEMADFTDSSGDCLHVYFSTESTTQYACSGSYYLWPPGSGEQGATDFLILKFDLVNEGSTLLQADDLGQGLTLVNTFGTPLTDTSCSHSSSFSTTNTASGCTDSTTNSVDLIPGDSALWCVVVIPAWFPTGTTLSEVQFSPGWAFTGTSFDTVETWHIPLSQ